VGECVARRHADLGDGVRIPVRAFEGVPIAALEQAARIIESMCKHCAAPLKHRLSTSRCSIAVIGEDQVTTDIPDHAWLRGKSCGDGRDYDSGTRGLGGACWATACSWANLGVHGKFYARGRSHSTGLLGPPRVCLLLRRVPSLPAMPEVPSKVDSAIQTDTTTCARTSLTP
jgi:hypothetical protein